MSFEDCEDRPHHYPNNYLEIQEENKRRKFEEEIQQLESSTRSLPSEINTLKKMVIGLTICFLIFAIYSQYSYGVLRVENERLIKEINENKYIFNQHIDYTIGYIQVLTDNLDKTIELLSKLKYPNVNNRPPIIYSYPY